MTNLMEFERRIKMTLESLSKHPSIECEVLRCSPVNEDFGSASEMLQVIGALCNARFPAGTREVLFRFEEVAAQWSLQESTVKLSGEFHVKPLLFAVTAPPPHISWKEAPKDLQRLHSHFRVIDDTPETGAGIMASMRMGEDSSAPEIWITDVSLGTYRMRIDYAAYMENLLVTKGTFGWHYLFTEAPLRESQFSYVRRNIQTMLQVFPRIFPGLAYAPLQELFAERLR
ncbi:hypothetical protein [Streptomyces yaizuensis]|uniref:Uncharacterized protein n=1 Tax=Streptomyces yaizuensis TaxID=2989713 RepID=A0ABQ5NSY7_9ACTN|nr:hypothetical protein [Streptomyces sp. YSPA8]GLF93126.1 hypothetical protein SYYSPA8_02535 [Streptomyces sp. YSPA8]